MAGIFFWDVTTAGYEDRTAGVQSAWDQVWVASRPMPGISWCEGKKGQRLDKKQAPGLDGSIDSHLGYDNADIIIRARIWTPQHWFDLQDLVPIVQPRPNKGRPQPVDVSWPGLALLGVSKLYVIDIELPKDDHHAHGAKSIAFICSEFAPRKTGQVLRAKTSINNVPRDGTTPSSGPAVVNPPSKTGVGP
jgi:hypothetical protein